MRIADALKQAQHRGLPRLDAQWLLGHVLQQDRAWLLSHDDAALSASQAEQWTQLLSRRLGGEPLAYVTGEQTFCGLRLHVSKAVLIPRPETEELVRWALQCLHDRPQRSAARVLDLGTGSGAVALAIQQAQPQAQVWASDISVEALALARHNARRLMLAVTFVESSWWQSFQDANPPIGPSPGFDLVVSNPPYIATGDPHLPALHHEPAGALVSGRDGLDDLRTLINGAPAHMAPGAWLLVEHGHDQADAVQSLMLAAGLKHAQTRLDLAGLARCTGARRPDTAG